MNDPEGRWMSFNISMMDYIILEKKGLPPHLASIENLDKPVALQSMLTDLEDQGEVARLVNKQNYVVLFNCQLALSNIKKRWTDFNQLKFPAKVKLEVSHHKLENSECSSTKALVFVLDEPPSAENAKVKKEKKGKKNQAKQQSPSITSKNFGAWVCIPKIKVAELLIVAWRCRCLGGL